VLDQEPANAEAMELKQKAEVCPPPPKVQPPPVATAPRLAVRIPPENGGLDPVSGEQDKDYQARVRGMRVRYDEALALLERGTYPRAIQALEGIVRDAGGRYLAAAAKLSEARRGAAGVARAEARDFELKNEYDQAIAAWRRVVAADPDPKIEDDLKRLQEKKTQAGLTACDQAKNAYAFNRPQQALQFYQQVVRFLPPEHPCFVIAKERIASIGR
jgi:tetratricopeptide (TPR) repeat protein